MKAKHRIISLISVLMLLMSLAAPLTAMAATDVQLNVELVTNGGFEAVSGSTPKNWNGVNTWKAGSVLSLVSAADDPGNVHSGNYAVKYEVNGGDNPFLSQVIYGIVPRCKYRVSFWYKAHIPDKKTMSVKFEYGGNKPSPSEYYSSNFGSAADWTYAEHEFYVPDGATQLSVMPRAYTVGTVMYVDDVSFKLVDTPEILKTETDWVFYYQEFDTGRLTATLDSFYDGNDYTLDVNVKRGLKNYINESGLKFTNNELVYNFDLTVLNKKTEYTMTINLRDKDNTIVKTHKKFIYRIDRPTNIREDGAYVEDGEIFEPIIAYHFDMNDAEDAVRAGVNVVQWSFSSATKEGRLAELDELHKKGMKASVVCYWGMRPAGHEANEANIKQLITDIKDHPAVFCYMVMDEPFSHASNFGGEDAMEDYLRNSYKIIRMIDDKHPVYLCEDQPRKYSTSIKYVDALGMDPYPGNGDFSKVVADRTLLAAEAAQGIKPLYTVVQSMSWKGVIPDGPMLRTQLYQAMMAGAQCVGYYPWVPDNKEIDVNLNKSRYWETMLTFNDCDKPVLYSYYSRGEYEEFASYRGSNYWYDIFTDGGIYYMTVLSRNPGKTVAEISLENAKGETVPAGYKLSVVSGGDIKDVIKNGNNVTVTMDYYGAVLYKLSPDVATGEIALLDKDGGITENASEADVVFANGFTSGDRIYIASYYESYGTQRLGNISVAEVMTGGYAVCKVNIPDDERYTVRAFVWSENMKSTTEVKLIK